GKEYTVTGKLMDKATEKPVLSNGKEVLGETTFTPEEPNGVVEVAFDLDARELAGSEVVVFEKLFRNGKEVVAHEDINDLDQTVRFIEKLNVESLDQPEKLAQYEQPFKQEDESKKLDIKGKTSKSEANKVSISKMPKTGDESSLLTILFGSLLFIMGYSLYKRKQHR
ncbi:LPXTG cell wall anchor domain-containing protein, partial [Listeria rocourtiae]|uniref:VaFE repeat-containing surface-anchored protein n=1 Tax=Listeria rocourtiae TaxID=647910 RepID=UPI001629EA48